MNTTPDTRSADPEQIIADLRRQLAEREAERDEGLQRETGIAEVLQVIDSFSRRPHAGVRRDTRKGDAAV